MELAYSVGADSTVTMGDQPEPFFQSKEEAWAFMEEIVDDLYKTMNMLNRDAAALAHIGESTGDIETVRYLIRKCWLHYKKRGDDLFDVYHDSDEYGKHVDKVVLDDFDKENNTST